MSAEIDLQRGVAPDATDGLIVDRSWSAAAARHVSQPAKAEPVPIYRGMTVAEGFETIVSACLRHFRLNEPLVIESRDVEGLHQARVAMRRLRSALALFRPVVRDHESDRIEVELRWFAAELGDARNLDVYLKRDLSEDQRRFVEERRTGAYDLAIAAMESPRLRRLILDLVAWARTGGWRGKSRASKALEPFVDRRIDRLWAKVAASDDIADMGDKRRHRLRIRMKKLRYALEFTEALHSRKPRRRKRFTKAVKSLQDSLGQLHDGVVCRSLVTLNSWIIAPNPGAKGERRLVRQADRAMRRLRKAGPYWR